MEDVYERHGFAMVSKTALMEVTKQMKPVAVSILYENWHLSSWIRFPLLDLFLN